MRGLTPGPIKVHQKETPDDNDDDKTNTENDRTTSAFVRVGSPHPTEVGGPKLVVNYLLVVPQFAWRSKSSTWQENNITVQLFGNMVETSNGSR